MLFALTLVARVKASRRIDALPIPLVIVAAGEEKLCKNDASKAVADRAPKGENLSSSPAPTTKS